MERKKILLLLSLQEIFLIFISLLWIFFRDYNLIMENGLPVFMNSSPFKSIIFSSRSIIYGISAGILLLILSFIISMTYDAFQESLKAIDSLFVSKLKKVDILPLAILSGVGEELFFRGILQEGIGIIWSSIIFALLHFPGREFWVYAFWALFASLFLGNIYAYTGNLLIVIIAHILNNFLALLLWSRYKNFLFKDKSDK